MIVDKPLRIGSTIRELLLTSPKVQTIVGKHIYPYLTQEEIRHPHIVFDGLGVTFEQTKDGELPSEIALTLNCNTTNYDLGIELGEAVIDVFEDHQDISVTYASCEYDAGANMFTHSITINITVE
ncbi:MAG: hypothetical protein II269_09335 [Bacteroidaceae bacterium]|nr:hypothetical protein [Bacteroidaceae bacterium]